MEIGDLSWDDLRVLLAVQRHESLLAAGRSLGLSTSTTARRLERLEAAVGRPLVVRSTTGTSIEPGARELVALAEQVEHGLRAVHRHESELGGTVRVSTGEGFAGPVAAVLMELRHRQPETSIEMVVETRLADLARREADLGIRTARSTSAVLVERRLGRVQFGLYAARAYVERRVRAARLTASDFARLDFIGPVEPLTTLQAARWLTGLGARRFVFRSNSDALLLAATRQAQGICVLADLVAASEPTLVRLECEGPPPTVPVWLVCHREVLKVPRVRAVADVLTAAVRARLSR